MDEKPNLQFIPLLLGTTWLALGILLVAYFYSVGWIETLLITLIWLVTGVALKQFSPPPLQPEVITPTATPAPTDRRKLGHDINNLMTIIHGNIELLRVNSKDEVALNAIVMGADRLADIAGHHGNETGPDNKPGPGAQLDDALHVLSTQLEEAPFSNARIDLVNTDPDLAKNGADARLTITTEVLMAIVMPLVDNACRAIADEPEGLVTVAVSPEEEAFAGAGGLKFSISDNGAGMDETTVSLAKTALFSRYRQAGNLGLGLYVSDLLASQAGGELSIMSAPGIGTSVSVTLPAHTGQRSADVDVLVVEDDDAVQRVIKVSFADAGYSFGMASSAEEAQDICKQQWPKVILSDVMLGSGMNGIELARWVKSQNADVAMLLMSGLADDQLMTMGYQPDVDELVRKPARMGHLVDRITSLL